MRYKRGKQWGLSDSFITDESLFESRRRFIKMGAAMAVSTSAVMELAAKEVIPAPNLSYSKDSNLLELKLNSYNQITSYNNFFKFTTDKKKVKPMAKNFKTSSWNIAIDGLVEKPFSIFIQLLE